jgi:magnesium-transporting ATPase (P-type)
MPQNATYAQKQMASSLTFFASAIWHGFHPAYFLVFFHFYFFTLMESQVMKIIRVNKKFEEFLENYKTVLLFFIRSFILLFLVPYHCLMFISLDYMKLYKFVCTVYAFGSVFVILANALLFIYISFFLKKGLEKSEKPEKSEKSE